MKDIKREQLKSIVGGQKCGCKPCVCAYNRNGEYNSTIGQTSSASECVTVCKEFYKEKLLKIHCLDIPYKNKP